MSNTSVIENSFNFSPLHDAMQSYVDKELFSGISSAVLVGQDLVDVHCAGLADREANIALRDDHIFRVFSNTKLVTSMAVLMLLEEGHFALDDPIEKYIPQLGNRQVLRPGATDGNDTEPAKSSITIRQLMTHTSGLSYGFLDPGTLIFSLYAKSGVNNVATPLSGMIDALEDLPLVFHPGTSWEYSLATDVLGRFVEIISGQSLDVFFQNRIFAPLNMVDTGFWCPPEKQDRLAAYYSGSSVMEPMLSGLTRADNSPYPDAFLKPFPRLSGGGGLVSTLPDMISLIRSLIPGGPALLKPDTMALMATNQLPDGQNIRFAGVGEMPGRGHGLAGSVIQKPFSHESSNVKGDLWWGGIAGTQWWVSPTNNVAGIVMTQRVMGFAHPFAADLKNRVYDAVVQG
ncbi:MAG: serine hydrolase domain-containing protein [Sneathiella sp.]